MDYEDVKVGKRYEIDANEATERWISVYAHEGLQPGNIVEIKEIYRTDMTGISIRNISLGRGHGINAGMLKEFYDNLEGAEDF